MEENVAGSNLVLCFDFFSLVEIFLSSHGISVHNEIQNFSHAQKH